MNYSIGPVIVKGHAHPTIGFISRSRIENKSEVFYLPRFELICSGADMILTGGNTRTTARSSSRTSETKGRERKSPTWRHGGPIDGIVHTQCMDR